jgi:hypothetical protein
MHGGGVVLLHPAHVVLQLLNSRLELLHSGLRRRQLGAAAARRSTSQRNTTRCSAHYSTWHHCCLRTQQRSTSSHSAAQAAARHQHAPAAAMQRSNVNVPLRDRAARSTPAPARSTEHGARSTEHGARSTEHGAWSMAVLTETPLHLRDSTVSFDSCAVCSDVLRPAMASRAAASSCRNASHSSERSRSSAFVRPMVCTSAQRRHRCCQCGTCGAAALRATHRISGLEGCLCLLV